MKRNKSFALILIVVLVLVFTSCTTTIAINRLVPAQVDVSGYKTIAVRSTIDETHWKQPSFWNSYVPFVSVDQLYWQYMSMRSYLDFDASSVITNAASDMITKAINTGFFTIAEPKLTDSLINVGNYNGNLRQTLLDNHIDAVLTTKITNMNYDEYITAERDSYTSVDKDGKKYYAIRFYLVQKYSMSISYTLSDVENNKIIASSVFNSDNKQVKTKIGQTINEKGEYKADSYTSIDSASYLLKSLINDFANKFRNELSPHYVTNYFDFMPNKPEVKSLKAAYDAVDNGNYQTALTLFSDEYARSGHVASGYNAAILYFAVGQYQKAYDLCNDLYKNHGSADALDLMNTLKAIESREKAAEKQIESTEKSGGSSSTGGGVIGI
jgi:hypothetical protein